MNQITFGPGHRFVAIGITALVVGTVALAAAPTGRGASEPAPALGAQCTTESSASSRFNHPGNILISDQYNNRVIEIEKSAKIVRSFGNGPADLTSGDSPVGVNGAQRVGGLTLVAGTGNPGGFGMTNPNQGMNGPYDAKVIGDYTGITPPRGFDSREHRGEDHRAVALCSCTGAQRLAIAA